MFVNKLMCNQSFSVVQENVLYLYFLIKKLKAMLTLLCGYPYTRAKMKANYSHLL